MYLFPSSVKLTPTTLFDDFNFPILNFPFPCSNIPAAYNKSNMMGFTNGAGTDNPSVAPEFTPVIIGVPVVPS